MDYFEFYNWSQRWIMDNFPPLPLVKYESPCYDPYEIDPSHYSDSLQDNFININYDLYDKMEYYNQHFTETYSDYDYEYESSESDLEEDPHDFN